MIPFVVERATDSGTDPWAVLRVMDSFGIPEADLLRAPSRLTGDQTALRQPMDVAVDLARVDPVPVPSTFLTALPERDTWTAMSTRSLRRLLAWFLVAEDPQRRLEARAVATLAHQMSLVHHVCTQPHLARVLIGDEVGLGKTVEAGLIVRKLLEEMPGLRVLYLSPARLVRNVRREFEKLGLEFRTWVAGSSGTVDFRHDNRVIASIHKASLDANLKQLTAVAPWDVVIVDEAHHLSDWAPGGGSPVQKYRLVKALVERQDSTGRLILMTGTPHQGNRERFTNLLALLRRPGENDSDVAGRVIYRTKDDVFDWDGRPLFPPRHVNAPIVLDLGAEHRHWLEHIHAFYNAPRRSGGDATRNRAAGWRSAQALQWAASSLQAGLGYLVRQAIRVGWTLDQPALARAIRALRPYRLGPVDEPVERLHARIHRETVRQDDEGDDEDLEEIGDEADRDRWAPDARALTALLDEGIVLLEHHADDKWHLIHERVLQNAGDEKVVLFAQPVETVTALARYLERVTGRRPAMILGAQTDEERDAETNAFWRTDGPQFLVSSRAGGEGINLQCSHQLVHVDVPWNPMDLEQRVGRVHRFGSKHTIVVDTVVVKGSREEAAYTVARQRLAQIANTLVAPEKFESTFERVMSLVQPAEMAEVLGGHAVAPLEPEASRQLSELVTRGFYEWQQFHDRFQAGRRLGEIDPGQASWDDLKQFVIDHLGAEPVEGFDALRFDKVNDKPVYSGVPADVVATPDGRWWALGDHGNMPITDRAGRKAEGLGLNVPRVAEKLREFAFPTQPAGAAHVRWPEGRVRPMPSVFAVIVAVRQSVKMGAHVGAEHDVSLHACIVGPEGEPTELDTASRGALLRTLRTATIRREAEQCPMLVAGVQTLEPRWLMSLKRPSSEDRVANIAHAIVPLLTVVVS